MYQKLFKNFVLKNSSLFVLIFVSIFLSLLGYIFSNALSSNFVNSIETDGKISLGGDFTIDIGNAPEEVFTTFYNNFTYKTSVNIAKGFSIFTSVETPDIIPLRLHYISEEYPFFSTSEATIIAPEGEIIISKELYESLEGKRSVSLIGEEYSIKGYYTELASGLSSFLGMEQAFVDISKYYENITDHQAILIEKKYFLENLDEPLFEEIKTKLKAAAKEHNFRVQDYKSGGDRFGDIISTLEFYINYAVLFSFFLTATIIFLSSASFFIKERKEISVLRLLGMSDKQFIIFYAMLFGTILLLGFTLATASAYCAFLLLQNIEITSGFILPVSSILSGLGIGVLILGFSISLPVAKFLNSEAGTGLGEDFFMKISHKELLTGSSIFLAMSLSLSLLLSYGLIASVITAISLLVLIIFFSVIINSLLKRIYNRSSFLRSKNFSIYDAIRSSVKPGNMSVLLSLSFFIIFSIGLFILILFGNFYQRLNINLENDNNFFALNLNGDTYKNLSPELQEDAFSMIKGRIISINSFSLEEHLESTSGGNPSRRFSREFNITDNTLSSTRILSGGALAAGGVSVDDEFAKSLNIQVGDSIIFQIYGIEKELTVLNIRESQDASINPFFYFQIDAEEFSAFPKIYFVSSFVEPNKIPETKKYFYNISNGSASFIEVDKILEELKTISTKVLLIIHSLFLYIAIFCILSIVVVGLFFSEFQKKNAHLYHLIGSTHKQNRIKHFSEYLYIATLMKLLALMLISGVCYFILSKNDFLSFDMGVYFMSVLTMIGVYAVILAGVWFGIRR